MTESDVERAVNEADRNLAAVVDRLIANPRHLGESLIALRQVASTLTVLPGRLSRQALSPSLKLSLGAVGTRAEDVRKLLDASAAFYCGALSAVRLPSESYGATGELYPAASSGYLNIQG
jgi:hypothetical protein